MRCTRSTSCVKARLVAQVDSQREGIDEEAEQSLDLRAIAPRDRRSDDHVGLSAVAMQQTREAGEQGHEQRGIALAPDAGKRIARVSDRR
jgi:hypothetical protein